MRLVPTFILACAGAVPLGLWGCGGQLTDGRLAGDDGGGDASPPPGNPTDSGPVPIDAPITLDTGSCLVDLEPCIYGQQCCSGACFNGACGRGGPPPACTPGGGACQAPTECCSGTCMGSVCGYVNVPDSGLCYPDGVGCSSWTQCCGGQCYGGVCGGSTYDAGPVCYGDGSYCTSYAQCCSGICGNGVCGGQVIDSGPTCSPDGFACQTYSECCSGVCAYGTCGGGFVDAGPPPVMCYPPTSTSCDQCMAMYCCPQLGSCESDPTCTAALSCFNSCYVPGTGNASTCSQKCAQAYPSPLASNLDQCTVNSCLGSCY